MFKNSNFFYFYYLYILGGLIITLHLYLRIFPTQEEVSLELLKQNLSLVNYFLLIFVLLIQVINLGFILKYLLNFNKKSKWTTYIAKVIQNIYWKPLELLHDILAPELPGSGKVIIFIANLVEKGNQKLRYKVYHHSYILFSYLPQLTISSIFFYEVIFLNKIYYFFKLLFILLIPPIFDIYIKLCISFHERNIEQFFEFLNVEGSDPDSHGNHQTWSFSFKPNYSQNSKELLNESISDYMLLNRIRTHAELIKKNRDKNYIYILVFTSIFYFIPSLYKILFYIYLKP